MSLDITSVILDTIALSLSLLFLLDLLLTRFELPDRSMSSMITFVLAGLCSGLNPFGYRNFLIWMNFVPVKPSYQGQARLWAAWSHLHLLLWQRLSTPIPCLCLYGGLEKVARGCWELLPSEARSLCFELLMEDLSENHALLQSMAFLMMERIILFIFLILLIG